MTKKDRCIYCENKGYSTEYIGDTTAYGDFEGDRTHKLSDGHIIIHLCKCNRGKDLKKYFTIKSKYKI